MAQLMPVRYNPPHPIPKLLLLNRIVTDDLLIDQPKALPSRFDRKKCRRQAQMGNGISWPTEFCGQLYECQTHQH